MVKRKGVHTLVATVSYQQQSKMKSGNFGNNIKQISCHYYISPTHSNDDCYHQRGGKFENNSSVDGKIVRNRKKSPLLIVTVLAAMQRFEKQSNESNDESYPTRTGIGLTFAACHLPLSQQADSFQILVDLGSSKHFINPNFFRAVESRKLEPTMIEPPMETRAARDNILHGTVQGILQVVVRGTDNMLRKVKLPKGLMPAL